MKDDENAKAVALLEEVIAKADAIEDIDARIEHLIKGVFSGNIFDLGAAQVFTGFILLCICGLFHIKSFWIFSKTLMFCMALGGFVKLAEIFESAGSNFQDSFEKLLPRPWVLDDLDLFKQKWLRKPWKKVRTFRFKQLFSC